MKAIKLIATVGSLLTLISSLAFSLGSRKTEISSPPLRLVRAEPGLVATQPAKPVSTGGIRRLPPVDGEGKVHRIPSEFSASPGAAPAAHQVPLALVSAAAIGQSGKKLRIATIQDGGSSGTTLLWDTRKFPDGIYLFNNTNNTIEVTVENVDPATPVTDLELKLHWADPSLPEENFGFASNSTSQTIPLKRAGEATISVIDKGAMPHRDPSDPIKIFVPDLNNPPRIRITHQANAPRADAYRVNAQAFKLFGDKPYLRLEGQNHRDSNLRFFVVDQAGKVDLEIKPVPRVQPNAKRPSNGWQVEMQIPKNIDAQTSSPPPWKMVVLNQKGQAHNYAEDVVPFGIAPPLSDPESVRPKIFVNGQAANKDQPILTKDTSFQISVEPDTAATFPADTQLVVLSSAQREPVAILSFTTAPKDKSHPITLNGLTQTRQTLTVQLEQGRDQLDIVSEPITVVVRSGGLHVTNVVPENFGTAPGVALLRVHFNAQNPLHTKFAAANSGTGNDDLKNAFQLRRSNGTGGFDLGEPVTIPRASLDPRTNIVTLDLSTAPPPADVYQLTIFGNLITDQFGNQLEGEKGKPGSNYVKPLGKLSDLPRGLDVDAPSVRPGITGATGPYVRYPEYTEPRHSTVGFNPADKVETRVARLYYFRDAHRVAQIINRRVKSFNRQGVDMARQLADKARHEADQLTNQRQHAERLAIEKARKSREIEARMQNAQNSLDRSLQELTAARRNGVAANDPVVASMEAAARSFGAEVERLRGEVNQARTDEFEAGEVAQQLAADERLSRSEQFRREVAAAHADPDTYAPGRPKSMDVVEQVSISVIGEGLIHLRGPLKGINVIRTMIDQIDAPVGQVRVAVHTVQINGEKEDRMEDVANLVQLYVDQARFLTMQSSELLRRAVVQVASRKAEEARYLHADAAPEARTQEARDARYLYAFFGQDFIDELRVIDSEFLHTGNKLLSLHSMDTTSLSSALNLLALAKNSTRAEILAEFETLVMTELPAAEQRNLDAGITFGEQHKCFQKAPKFYPLAERAQFESLKGFFKAEIAHDDTLSPVQREFIRLAQIFKSRLITELEYKQRVRERAIIEERIGDPRKDAEEAREKEYRAEKMVDRVRGEMAEQRTKIMSALAPFLAVLRNAREQADKARVIQGRINSLKESTVAFTLMPRPDIGGKVSAGLDLGGRSFVVDYRVIKNPFDPTGTLTKIELPADFDRTREFDATWKELVTDTVPIVTNTREFINSLKLPDAVRYKQLHELDGVLNTLDQYSDQGLERTNQFVYRLWDALDLEQKVFDTVGIEERVEEIEQGGIQLLEQISQDTPNVVAVYQRWLGLRKSLIDTFDGDVGDDVARHVKTVEKSLEGLASSLAEVTVALENAKRSRRPLDHKKFLDMLVDDLEEKYIELLDGTRAHTANVDNYIKRLTTALDDDFNTQFYHPTFRYVRQASTSWDVQFGQTETTSILANNRDFAKVTPSASMEFDLPKRDILLKEALDGGMATVQSFGALLNDPSFLAASKVGAGGSTANPAAGSTGGFGVVRDVLPGLSTDTSEQVLSQNANGGSQFGAPLENLIPDPAIYKFETGTGYEIRPVIQPDGQAVVFDFNYLYTTNIHEPVRPDEKHLGRVKQHLINTDVQLSNFELREVSRYSVALKAARTSRGVPLLEDIPIVGALWRPLPSDESSLQQNVIMAQATIFPTLFDLMGLRWAPAVADLDPLRLSNAEYVVRSRQRFLENCVYDDASSYVDEFLRIPEPMRRTDLYRTQESIPRRHPNGYSGPGLDYRDGTLQEGYQPHRSFPQQEFIPGGSREGSPYLRQRGGNAPTEGYIDRYPLEGQRRPPVNPQPIVEPQSSRHRAGPLDQPLTPLNEPRRDVVIPVPAPEPYHYPSP